MKYFLMLLLLVVPVSFLAAQEGLVPCGGPECQACHLIQLINNIVRWLISFMIVAAGLLFAYAGLLMVTSAGNQGQVTKAKGIFANVVIGLIITLAAWLIIDTILKGLVSDQVYGMWNQIQCVDQPVGTARTGGSLTTATRTVGPNQSDNAAAAARLSSNGIQVTSSGNCSDYNNRSCTSLEGVQNSTLAAVENINTACPSCDIRVTAGTEVGHSNSCHVAGTCVDIACTRTGTYGCSTQEIVTVLAAHPGTVFEVVTEGQRTALVNELVQTHGVPRDVAEQRIDAVEWASAPHFSLYANNTNANGVTTSNVQPRTSSSGTVESPPASGP